MEKGYIKRVLVYSLLSAVNRVIPKKKRIVIYGGHRLYDNNEAMFTYLLENTPYDIICLATKHKEYELRRNVKFVPATNMNAIRYIMTSTVQIDSFLHAVRMRPCKKQLFIQLWHGTPLKKIDKTQEKDGAYYTKILYPSKFYIREYIKTFAAKRKQMVLNGMPRNDFLFKPMRGSFLEKYDGIKVLWMPTYRHAFGTEETKRDIPVIDEKNIAELDSYLNEKGITLFLKPHPAQRGSFKGLIKENFRNIILIDDNMLDEHGVVLYSFIGAMDALITDYSSVYFDYLLLDRPIGFAIDDVEEYRRNRGFVFDNILDYMPGEKIYSFDELKTFFDHLHKGQDDYSEKRKKVNDLVNHWQDAGNCERCKVLIDDFMKQDNN